MADIVDDIIKREDPSGKVVNDPNDHGGPTIDGISEAANPDLWKNGPPTVDQIRQRYEAKYVNGPGFDKITDTQLRNQLIDFGVNSGPAIAIMNLQEILGVPKDGILGPATLAALSKMHPEDANNALVAQRIKLIGRIVAKNPSQLKFLNGWLDRALQFLG